MERHCGWCARTAAQAAALTRCGRHEQCTEAVRAERARLYGLPARKYRLQGSRRRLHAHGAHEPFDTVIIASSVGDAQTVARDNWAAEWKNILFKSVSPVS